MYGKIKGGNGGRESILKSEGRGGMYKTPSSLPNSREKWGRSRGSEGSGIIL